MQHSRVKSFYINVSESVIESFCKILKIRASTGILLPLIGRMKHCTKNKFFIKGFFNKCDQICGFLQICSHLLKKSLMGNFIFSAVKKLPTFSSQTNKDED